MWAVRLRLARPLAAGMLLVLALTGCVTKGSSMTPDEARDSLTTLFGETQKLVGGTWEVTLMPSPVPVTRSLGARVCSS